MSKRSSSNKSDSSRVDTPKVYTGNGSCGHVGVIMDVHIPLLHRPVRYKLKKFKAD